MYLKQLLKTTNFSLVDSGMNVSETCKSDHDFFVQSSGLCCSGKVNIQVFHLFLKVVFQNKCRKQGWARDAKARDQDETKTFT